MIRMPYLPLLSALVVNIVVGIKADSDLSFVVAGMVGGLMLMLIRRERRYREGQALQAEYRDRQYLYFDITNGSFPSEGYKQAEQRAEQLFLSSLTPQQRAEWKAHRGFSVIGSDNCKYWVTKGVVYNVYQKLWTHSTIPAIYEFCAGPQAIPLHDRLLAQKLLIQTNAEQFKAIAHKSLLSLDHPMRRSISCLLD